MALPYPELGSNATSNLPTYCPPVVQPTASLLPHSKNKKKKKNTIYTFNISRGGKDMFKMKWLSLYSLSAAEESVSLPLPVSKTPESLALTTGGGGEPVCCCVSYSCRSHTLTYTRRSRYFGFQTQVFPINSAQPRRHLPAAAISRAALTQGGLVIWMGRLHSAHVPAPWWGDEPKQGNVHTWWAEGPGPVCKKKKNRKEKPF